MTLSPKTEIVYRAKKHKQLLHPSGIRLGISYTVRVLQRYVGFVDILYLHEYLPITKLS